MKNSANVGSNLYFVMTIKSYLSHQFTNWLCNSPYKISCDSIRLRCSAITFHKCKYDAFETFSNASKKFSNVFVCTVTLEVGVVKIRHPLLHKRQHAFQLKFYSQFVTRLVQLDSRTVNEIRTSLTRQNEKHVKYVYKIWYVP